MVFQLTNTSEIAEEQQNTAGQRDNILTVQPKDGTAIILKGMVQQGEDPGIPIFGSFYNQAGDPIDQRSALSLRFESPGDDDAQTVTHPLTNLLPYNSLDIPQQQDTEKVDRVKHVIKGTENALADGEMPQVVVGHLDQLHLTLESDDVIDWSHLMTKVYFARQAVEEVN
jgi:hypothetical protein